MVDGSAYATDLRGPLRITRPEISRRECVKSFISKGMDRHNINSVTGGEWGYGRRKERHRDQGIARIAIGPWAAIVTATLVIFCPCGCR